MLKIVILSESPLAGSYTRQVLNAIASDNRMEVTGVVVHRRQPKPLKSKVKSFLRRLKGGVFLAMLIEKRRRGGSRAPASGKPVTFAELFNKPSLPAINIKQYDSEALNQIEQLGGHLLILAGYHQIVRQPLIKLFPRGVLSYHYGDMRKYRGQPPIFWEMLNGEKTVGITVQQLNNRLDGGYLVKEKAIEIEPADTIETMEVKILEASIPMMHEAVCCYLNSDFQPELLPQYGKVYTFPDIISWIKMEWRALHKKTKNHPNKG